MTAGGLEHSLTPLAAACPAIHIFDTPTRWLDALWLPYRRHNADLEAAVRAANKPDALSGHEHAAAEDVAPLIEDLRGLLDTDANTARLAGEAGPIKAVFAHAGVVSPQQQYCTKTLRKAFSAMLLMSWLSKGEMIKQILACHLSYSVANDVSCELPC